MSVQIERRRAERRRPTRAEDDLSPSTSRCSRSAAARSGRAIARCWPSVAKRCGVESQAALAEKKTRRRGAGRATGAPTARAGATLSSSEVSGGERRRRLRGQALVALAETGQARIGLAVAGLEVGLAAPADVHLRARHHRLDARLAGRPGSDVLGLRLAQLEGGVGGGRRRESAVGAAAAGPLDGEAERRVAMGKVPEESRRTPRRELHASFARGHYCPSKRIASYEGFALPPSGGRAQGRDARRPPPAGQRRLRPSLRSRSSASWPTVTSPGCARLAARAPKRSPRRRRRCAGAAAPRWAAA